MLKSQVVIFGKAFAQFGSSLRNTSYGGLVMEVVFVFGKMAFRWWDFEGLSVDFYSRS